jgi:hypothetical protein
MFGSKKRAAKKALDDAHGVAMNAAQAVYDKYKGQDVVITHGRGVVINGETFPNGVYVSAAGPYREAWDEYFDVMLYQGYFPKETRDRFDKELKR